MKHVIDRFESAKQIYKSYGIDVDKALKKIATIPVSIQCWQGDDVKGFESSDTVLTGGIQATGNYLGKAKNIAQLRSDIECAIKCIPGVKRLNLHAIYLDSDKTISRKDIEPEHFKSWASWGKKVNLHGIDFNPTCFSHPNSEDGFTLSHPNKEVRNFWIEHCKASRQIGDFFAQEFNTETLTNIWIPDGMKDIPYNRSVYRQHLKDSLDEILQQSSESKLHWDCVESKLFGIGSESYVVGSHEFYMSYAQQKQIALCLDMGHFHPTEGIVDKLSSISLFIPKILLHVSRAVRWDSDHVVLFNDEVKDVFSQLSRCNLWDKTAIGVDYFDASINRIMAWVIGLRNVQKGILYSLLESPELLQEIENNLNFGKRLALFEEMKTLPFSDIWDYYCYSQGVPIGKEWISFIEQYEQQELLNR